MFYNLCTNSPISIQANFKKVLNIYTAIITNKPVADADMSMFNAPYSQPILGKYPTARPYTLVYTETDPTDSANVTLWFKKEHPLYAGHFLYTGVHFIGTNGVNTFTYPLITIDIAELVTEDGTIINRVNGSQYTTSNSYNFYTFGSITSLILGRTNNWYNNLVTLSVSDWGLGFFLCDYSGNALNAAFTHYQGTLHLEALSTASGDSASPQAFIPKNYPMQMLITQKNVVNGIPYNYRYVGLCRAPNAIGADATISNLAYRQLDAGALFQQPSNGFAPGFAGTFGLDNTIMEVTTADGTKASELYPEYLRNMWSGSPIAKLPVLRPLQGGANYSHYGRTITIGTENYMGIQALMDSDVNLQNIVSNIYLKALKTIPARQAYLRMD